MLLLILLSRRIGGIDGARVWRSFVKISSRRRVMGVAAYYADAGLHAVLPPSLMGYLLLSRLVRVLGAIGAGIGTLALAAWALHIEEFRQAMRRLLSRFTA